MQPNAHNVDLSASDLGRFLSCRHLTALDLAVAKGLRAKPPKYPDPVLELLIDRGFEHEQRFVDEQKGKGVTVVDLKDLEDRVARTIEAMKAGADLIVQGQVEHDGWGGYPDVLRRIETASPNLGDWSYEVIDTKLTKETKGTTILQLALYSEIVGIIQGVTPEFFYVVTPDKEERYRFNDYAAYYRLVKRGLAAAVTCDPGQLAAAHYPEPVDHCELCRWEMDCKKKRRADDHLSLVAGISRLQRRELEPRGVMTLEALGTMPLPLTPRPERGSPAAYERVREQARVQLEGRQKNANIHELLLPVKEGEGLTRLPEPSPGDIFLDLEGEPFSREGGREYLFGIITTDAKGKLTYEKHWAFADQDECAAFETVMDRIMAAWKQHPGAHVYHYAPYEPSAFKRLMGRYATRESDMDRLLRGGRFIDLYGVVKQSVWASVEKYSIKDLEKFYGFTREMDDLRKAGDHRALMDRCLQTDSVEAITDEDRTIVETYNKDDCVSTLRLRDWLEELRAGLVAAGTEVPRPALEQGEPSEELTEHQQQIRALMDDLLKDVPADRSARLPEQQARWILAQLLEYHRREDKVAWWEFFRLAELPLEEYEDEPRAIIGLTLVERLDPGKRNTPLDRYAYPDQECYIQDGDLLHDADGELGTVMDQDRAARTIDVKKRQARAGDHPSAVYAHKIVKPRPLPEALERIGQAVVESGLVNAGSFRAAWSLLTGERPRLGSSTFARRKGEPVPEFAVRIVTDLDGTVLPIQGPPGSGKTFTGAQMICELVQKGKRVGVTGPSHKVIENLLCKVVSEAKKSKRTLVCGAKVKQESEAPGTIREFTDNGDALDALRAREIHVLGGTPWLWAHEDALGSVDVLVCDEAGQMSLTNVVAASGAADSIVLLGDPQQLEQVQQGSHPDGTDVSALEHILGEHRTMPDDCGIFLPETWRMHPDICAFCSDVFYESRLGPRAGLEKQALTGVKRFEGAGLWVVHVEHEGNQNDSPEEVDAVESIVNDLLGEGARWTDEKGNANPMTRDDILVVAPYNRQVTQLYERLSPRGVKVGTVDKFQGREAAVVIYSMASSSPSDASRGMEFLYSLSRLNVATSRARCATILVASPKLFEPECKSPRQMMLANALCRYVELARRV